jgi:hypothetical protein
MMEEIWKDIKGCDGENFTTAEWVKYGIIAPIVYVLITAIV